ncbi:DUF3800 domain-containing protein [Alkalimonas collagenimarina]|uniref:DUF3800 domain-containing protein n=1 Tax=Alkalimonas collagenimarina TaxID=400390 RepID=A0ABT9GUI3_9GAMM|nr:DUF3800 domain-containing protein [Alkalimonas collagenimarina]MDP4534707.1 DUF3800 domain-containing protein [Alkalimonas collagenimarina]
MSGELKWEKVRSSAGQINLCLETLKLVLESPCTFHAIAVEKAPYRKWHENEENAFYVTYNYLLRQSSKGMNANCKVFIDQRSTTYGKQEELMEIITNHMLAKLPTYSKIEHVKMDNSKLQLGLQAVDLLTGAINTSYQLYFRPEAQIKAAKKIAISLMAKTLGWDSLAYDTYPNDHFNIWHFPIETRGKPKTEHVFRNLKIKGISRDEYEVMSEPIIQRGNSRQV